MDLGIRGKVALVTGGSKGIGRAVSLELAAAGAKVAVIARERTAIDAVTAEIAEQGGSAIGISADLSKLETYDAIVADTTQRLGAPDIAVFNMETPAPGSFAELDEAAFAYAFHIVVLCYARMVRCVLPTMKARRWGRIVTIGSGAAKQLIRGNLNFAYALTNTTRVAAAALMKTISTDVASYGITVNGIGTGAIETGYSTAWFKARAQEAGIDTDGFLTGITSHIPAGRLGQPVEMAALCAYLCSTRASYTTGETILCDGGMTNSIL
jgi:3-oxoacyl-[acyl-carrier protein] reductase